jgi:DNA recombination protein RmuC
MSVVNIFIISLLVILILLILIALNKINSTLNQKLSEVRSDVTKHLSTSQSTLSNITKGLTNLENTSQKILETGKDIQSLQDILKPPKLRGEIGQTFLENILSQVLPPNHFQTQYKFQNGNIVDAVVKLKDSRLLCIDSKFPLSSLKEYMSNDKSLNETPAQFIRDVKKHIDDIANKYILPKEGTLDFALMYIPAENVYYEIILRDDKITSYARDKKVIPVSPISLYSYLSTILIGLKGVEIEKNARQILDHLNEVKNKINSFISEFNTVGTHLNNAKSKYDSSRELMTAISDQLKNIEISKNE